MNLHRIIVLLGALVLTGCGQGMSGTYEAEVEQVSTPGRVDPGYSLQDVRQKLNDAPRTIHLQSGGRFETREGGRVVWTGTWRTEGDKLFLRAQTVNGVKVGSALQYDKQYLLRDGAIIDDGTYSAYGLHLIYRKP